MTAPAPVVFIHAHPDDEAIFTGGTMSLLADAGHRVILVLATSGELGASTPGSELAEVRRAEATEAARILGVTDLIFLPFEDSGLLQPGDLAPPGSLAAASGDEIGRVLVRQLSAVVDIELGIDSLVTYDETGIYGHVDHVRVHEAGLSVAQELGVDTVHEATVDAEYLHFVETHVVEHAGASMGRPLRPGDHLPADQSRAGGDHPRSIGSPTVLIDCEIDVSSHLQRKRDAMAAHGSQLAPDSAPMSLPPAAFAAVYGREWYRRTGPPALIDELGHSSQRV